MNLRRRLQTMQTYLRQREEALRFDGVADPRDERGRRWALAALLGAALVSLVLLSRSLRRAEQLTADLASSRLLRRLGVRRRVPDSTLGDALALIDPDELVRQLHRQVRAEHRRKALRPERLPVGVVSIDGKTQAVLDRAVNRFCQKQSGEGAPDRFVYRVLNASLVSAAAAVCIHQRPIPAETNETGFFADFFAELRAAYARADLFEVVMSDAGVLCEAHCRALDALGLGYVLALKNRPELEREARAVFAGLTEQPAEVESGWELDSSRGWVKRQLWTTTELAGWPGFEHLRQVWLVRVLSRQGKDGDTRLLEERLYLTNLPCSHRLRGLHILTLVRAHWRIENELHGTLDLELREDDPWWVRRGNGLQNVGVLRAMAYNALAVARSVHLRRDRPVGWQQLRDWLRDAIVFDGLVEPEPQGEPALA